MAALIFIVNLSWLAWNRRWITERYLNQGAWPPVVFSAVSGIVVIGLLAALDLPDLAGPVTAVVTLGAVSVWIDTRTFRLPLKINGLLALELLIMAALETVTPWMSALLGAIVWGLPLFIGNRAGGRVGKGDVIFGSILGFWLGTMSTFWALVGLLLANLALLLWVGFRGRGNRFAFGPYLWGAAIFVWFVQVTGFGPQMFVDCGKLVTC